MMDITKAEFKRQFSMSLYKNLRIPLAAMTFSKDFVGETARGDLYPVIQRTADCREAVSKNRYIVSQGSSERMIGRFFPFASHKVRFQSKGGTCGFGFQTKSNKAFVLHSGSRVVYACGDEKQTVEVPFESNTMIVSCRPGAFDVYFVRNERPEWIHTFESEAFLRSHHQNEFMDGFVTVVAQRDIIIEKAEIYIDNGISTADIRPVRYENGRVMLEMGKLYFTASIRMQAQTFQGVFSWVPGTADIEMTGALYYDAGDGTWCGDVAASILYHRDKKFWYLWVCSFSHDHILAHAAFDGDPRFGVNVIDVQLMPKAADPADITVFAGFSGDEDPDFFYDDQRQKWLMAICRLDPSSRKYRYVFFESDDPFEGYTFIGMGHPGEETGGSFAKINDELHFVCGNSFSETSDYRIYRKDGMHQANFNFPDGGFRGWGTLIPVKQGSRTRYYWLTFDRHNGSGYNWSYGNFYCFEATGGDQ